MLMGAKGYAKEVFTFGAPRAFFDGENTKCPAVTKEFRSFRFVNNFQLYTGCSEPGNGECQKQSLKKVYTFRGNPIAYREVWDLVPMVPPSGSHCATHSFRLKSVTERPAGHRSSFDRWVYGDPLDIWVPKEDLINEIGENVPSLKIYGSLKGFKSLLTAHSSVTYATVLCQSGWLNKPDPGGGEDLNTPICSEPVRIIFQFYI